MDRHKLISTLRQIKAIVDEAIGGAGHEQASTTSAPRSLKNFDPKVVSISFNANVLAFMNKHARGLKGSQKFTLLLARLTKGSTAEEKSLGELKKQWNKMKSVLDGEFNPAHANRAKARGWVDSPKHGIYSLSTSWKECLPKSK